MTLFPEDRLPTFEELAVSGTSLKGFSFDSLERQISIRINRVDLFDKTALHTYHIALTEACQFIVDLIFHSPLTDTWQVMILPTGAAWAKRDAVETLSMIGNWLATVIGSNTECIYIMLFGQSPGFAQRCRLVAKGGGKGGLC